MSWSILLANTCHWVAASDVPAQLPTRAQCSPGHDVRNCVNSSQQFVPGLNSRTRNAFSRVPGNIMSYDISALTFSTCPRRGTRFAQFMGITGTGSLGKDDMDSDFVFQVSPGAAEVPLSVLKIRDEAALEALDQLAVEEPLEIRLGGLAFTIT